MRAIDRRNGCRPAGLHPAMRAIPSAHAPAALISMRPDRGPWLASACQPPFPCRIDVTAAPVSIRALFPYASRAKF